MMKKVQSIKIIALVIVCCFTAGIACAQTNSFKYKADIQKIDTSGVYRIMLGRDLVSKSLNYLHDIRIFDDKGKTVAYDLHDSTPISTSENFVNFPEVRAESGTDTTTVFIAENAGRLSISHLWVELRNTDVSRTVNITGSDDLDKWFAIKEDIPLQIAPYSEKPEFQQSFDFPTSNYRYFRIQINDKHKTPVKVLQAGVVITSMMHGIGYAEPIPAKFTAKDSGKHTVIFIHLPEQYSSHILHFGISAPKYYKRHITVINASKKTLPRDGNDVICDTVLNPSGANAVKLIANIDEVKIDIENGDDNPLTIRSISVSEPYEYLVSYLEKGHDYYVVTGDAKALKPDYDLSFTDNRNLDSLPVIKTGTVSLNNAYKLNKPAAKSNNNILIWFTITAALVILGTLTFRMAREINK